MINDIYINERREVYMNKRTLSYHEFFYEKLGEENFFDIADNKPYNMFFERPAMIEEFPELEGKSVLDAGSAAGWYSSYFVSKGALVTALDISDNMLYMLKKRLGDKVNALKCDLNEGLLFLEDNSFDFVMSSLTLDFVEDWDNMMKEFYRVLKKDGILLFSVEHPYDNFSANHLDTYFQTVNMEHPYEDFDEKVSVWFYKRPLEAMISPVLKSGLQIVALKEPKPTPEFKKVLPDLYDFYMTRPEYLIVKAKK